MRHSSEDFDNRGVVTTEIYWPLAHLGPPHIRPEWDMKSLESYREFLALAERRFRPQTAQEAKASTRD